ncbi:MAG: IS982 family transposase [Saprospiraceae bacterium]
MSDSVKIVEQTIYLFVILDDILCCLGHQTDKRACCSDSEIITTAMVAALHFGGNHADAIGFVKETGLMPTIVSESRFNRRLHTLAELTVSLFFQLGHVIKSLDAEQTYRIDSFPVKSCHNIRICRSKLFKGNEFRGRSTSKREYFYGVKVFIITNSQNIPVEYSITPGSWAEIDGLRQLPLDLPQNSVLFGDSGFTDYTHEDDLAIADNINLKVSRKKNSKKPHKPWWDYLIQMNRKPIETTFSELTALFGKKIHATTQKGFILKLVAFIFAFTLDQFIN